MVKVFKSNINAEFPSTLYSAESILQTNTRRDEVNEVNSTTKGIFRNNWNSTFFENLTWLTSNEATEYLRLPSVGALRVLVCKRKIPFHKLGRSLRFKKSELDRLLEDSR